MDGVYSVREANEQDVDTNQYLLDCGKDQLLLYTLTNTSYIAKRNSTNALLATTAQGPITNSE